MAINFLNYRHSHLHALQSTTSGAGSKCRDWPGEDISDAEARAANGAKQEARLPAAAEEQADRNTPGLADSAMVKRMGEASSSFPSAQVSVGPSYSFPCSGHWALLKMGRIPVQGSGRAG